MSVCQWDWKEGCEGKGWWGESRDAFDPFNSILRCLEAWKSSLILTLTRDRKIIKGERCSQAFTSEIWENWTKRIFSEGYCFKYLFRPPTNSQKASKERASPLKGASIKYVIQTCTICFCVSFDLWFEETFKIYNVWFLLSRGQMLISRLFSWFLPKYSFGLFSVWAVPKLS